ncbi:MAG: hypothetical protein N4A38_04265 [Candidatus Gracilibacteria bacterium]|nr:hypothetical protein [Candidatus Gracilibacteria bacterium]
MQKFDKENFNKFNKHFSVKNNYSDIEKNYIKKTEKYLKYINFLPGIRLVAIVNSLSMKAANKDSDIDLFIVTTPNSMWLNRILITLFFAILGQRKTKNKHAGKFCLSFFITENNLNLENIAIKNDIYLYFWIVYLKPIISNNNIYNKFIEENKKWADFSEYKKFIQENKKFIKYSKNKKKTGKIVNFFDKIMKKIFLKKTLKNYEKLNKPYGIIINDKMLKFHNNDIRKEMRDNII